MYPDIWKLCNTKHIDAPGTYVGFKHVAVGCVSSLVGILTDPSDPVIGNSALAVGVLCQYDYPTYYVGRQMLESLMHTAPPKETTWNDVVWPFPAMVFMLPKGALIEEYTGDEINYIVVAHVEALGPGCGTKLPGINIDFQRTQRDERVTVWYATENCTVLQDSTFPLSQPLAIDPVWLEQATQNSVKRQELRSDCPATFSSFITGLAANMLMVMQVHKETVEKGVRGKRLKSGVHSYSPTWLGHKYVTPVVKTQVVVQGGRYTEIGWRSGSWIRYHVGEGRTQVVRKWVKPYMAFCKKFEKVVDSV